MKSNQKNTVNDVRDRLAITIAGHIIRLQTAIASRLNFMVNRYPARRQKWVLLLFSTFVAAIIIVRAYSGAHAVQWPKQNGINPAPHIGQASDPPKPRKQSTNSLTLKNDRYGK